MIFLLHLPCSSFTSSSSYTLKLPAPADWLQLNLAASPALSESINAYWLQLHLAADFCITTVYEQPLLRLTQHTEATSTHPQLSKVLHNRLSDHPASATSNWISRPATSQPRAPTQTTRLSLGGPIFIVIDSPNKSWPFELIHLSLSFLHSWWPITYFSKVCGIDEICNRIIRLYPNCRPSRYIHFRHTKPNH